MTELLDPVAKPLPETPRPSRLFRLAPPVDGSADCHVTSGTVSSLGRMLTSASVASVVVVVGDSVTWQGAPVGDAVLAGVYDSLLMPTLDRFSDGKGYYCDIPSSVAEALLGVDCTSGPVIHMLSTLSM